MFSRYLSYFGFNFLFADELLLSAIQPTFEYGGGTWSNCSLLHKLLTTGQGEQVVSRRGELDRDLLSSTCEVRLRTYTEIETVSYRVVLRCRLEIEILCTLRMEQNNIGLAMLSCIRSLHLENINMEKKTKRLCET